VIDTLAAFCQRHPRLAELDGAYLAAHFPRFVQTLKHASEAWQPATGARVLDIGTHWLHQAALWQAAGYEVTGADVALTLHGSYIEEVANAASIRLLRYQSLEHPLELNALADDSVDLVLFTEVLEHLTFNPVEFWRQIYRVLRPGGRIIVTTPNYYAWRSRLRQLARTVSRQGAGISVHEILAKNTMAHHWKEYAMREVVGYFELLSPDFRCTRRRYMDVRGGAKRSAPQQFANWLLCLIPSWRNNLYLEIDLIGKTRPIAIEPRW